MLNNGMRSVHPGEVLREDCLKPLGLSASALARALHVPASRINDIVLERRGITADMALRLTRHFGGNETDAQGWVDMQASCYSSWLQMPFHGDSLSGPTKSRSRGA